jgi:hypothetical protein
MIYFIKFLNILLIIINLYFYFFIKNLKTHQKVLEKNKFDYDSYKVSLLKNISFFILPLLFINLLISLNKFIHKIPLLGSLYNFILFIFFLIQLMCYFKIIEFLEKNNKKLKLDLNTKLYKLLINIQYKIYLFYIVMVNIVLFYV